MRQNIKSYVPIVKAVESSNKSLYLLRCVRSSESVCGFEQSKCIALELVP